MTAPAVDEEVRRRSRINYSRSSSAARHCILAADERAPYRANCARCAERSRQMSVERASGNRRSDQPVTRRGWLIAGVVGLILVVIGVGVGIAAGIGSGGSSTCSGSALFQVAVLRMACPGNSPL